MAVQLRLASPMTYEQLLPILSDADEGDERILARLTDGKHTTYAAYDDEHLIGAATIRWEEAEEEAESEIEYIAVVKDVRGKGYGKAIMAQLIKLACERHVAALLVGTANTSWENIAFYQKCGFRMDHVRRDYFAYIQPLLIEHGIVMRDMLVLRYQCTSD